MRIISLHINILGFICIVNITPDYLVKHTIKIDNSISMNKLTCNYKECHYANYKYYI